jgi:hypothetical protein
MKKGIFKVLMVGFICTLSLGALAQERGDTDITNNRKKSKNKEQPQVNSQQATPTKFIEFLPGTWTVEQVLRGKEDITGNDTLNRNQRIEFNREGRFVSYSGNEQIDSGAYRLSEQHALLYLETEGNEEDDTEYNIWFEGNGKMILQPRNTDNNAEQFKYVYKRSGPVTSSNRD